MAEYSSRELECCWSYLRQLVKNTSAINLCSALFITSVKIIKNEVGCRDDTVPKTVETRRHCEED